MIETTEQAIRGAADRYAHYYGDIRRHLAGEFAAEVKWLTASLFALNAGGLAALAGLDKTNYHQKWAGFGFWVGILLAFLFILYSQHKTKKFISIIQHLEQCYVMAAVTGELDQPLIARLEKEKGDVNTGLSSFLSIGSFVSFSMALVLFGCQT